MKNQKEIEVYMLAAARRAGVPIPNSEKPGLEPAPDFIFENDGLGIELTELMRPADDKNGFPPAAEEAFHREVLQMTHEQYYGAPDARPPRLVVYFSTGGKKRNKQKMADALSEFVRANVHRANPVVGFGSLRTPDGIGSMSITSECGDWWSGECGGTTLSQIRTQLAHQISDKNERVKQYRASLPKCYRVWLLIYSGVAVSRSMPIPHGIEEWALPFEFDKVFWFDCLEGRAVEIRPA
jgi:hypothetical protein